MPKGKGHMMPDGKMYYAKARGFARGGVPAASVGGDIGRWLGDWVQSWLGFENGGEVQQAVADLSESEQNQLLREAKKDLIKAVKLGNVDLPADAPVAAASVGGDIGNWLGDWIQSWLGLARGGTAMARGGMACARGGEMASMKRGHSVFR